MILNQQTNQPTTIAQHNSDYNDKTTKILAHAASTLHFIPADHGKHNIQDDDDDGHNCLATIHT